MACRPAGSACASLTSCPTPSLKENLQRQRSDARTIPDTGCSDGHLAVVSEQDVRMPSANRRSSSRGPCRPCRPPSDPATCSCLFTATTESSDCSHRCRTARCGARPSIQYRAARICHLVVDHLARLLVFQPPYHRQTRVSRRRFYDSSVPEFGCAVKVFWHPQQPIDGFDALAATEARAYAAMTSLQGSLLPASLGIWQMYVGIGGAPWPSTAKALITERIVGTELLDFVQHRARA
jgi:hypothetical protein